MSDGQAMGGAGRPVMERARQWFSSLPEKKRQNLVKAVLVGVGLVAILAFYSASKDNAEEKRPKPRTDVATISLGDSRLEDDLRAQVEKERTEFRAENQQQTKDLNEQRAKVEATEKQLEIMTKALQAMSGGEDLTTIVRDGAKPPARNAPPDDPGVWEAGSARSGALPKGSNNLPPAAPLEVKFVGDIGVAAQALPVSATGEKSAVSRPPEQGGKKNTRKFFLPTSFMSAKLLTGLKAKTVDAAKEDPEPMLLRVQAPAVLPNEVRAQLQGCFVVAHGYGSLASERVESRLVSLSCVDYEGRSIIEQEITGILVDKDGVKGLAGHPVTKMGANISRMFVAGLVEGAGQAVEQTSMTTSVSPVGQIQTIDPDRVGQNAMGRGLSRGAGELSKIYADLVRQSAPVVEVGPGKEVSVFITQGVWLEVQEYEQLAETME
jgi:conjugal transfer pilus assembly protein TraB